MFNVMVTAISLFTKVTILSIVTIVMIKSFWLNQAGHLLWE